MNVTNIMYPHYWQTLESCQGFPQHLVLIKVRFGHQKPLGPNGTFVLTLVDGTFFEHQFSFFKVTIQHQSKQDMEPPFDDNPTSSMWQKIASSVILNQWLLEWFKLVDLCLVIVLGSVENKCIFSNLNFIIQVGELLNNPLGLGCPHVCRTFLQA